MTDMEKSSPTDGSSPGSAGHSSNGQNQPTYTTAGTIYNPNSSQPLQPPTRRGRSLKWTSGGAYPDLSLLPRSLLSSLPKANTGRVSPYPSSYTPLQQNYDRAALPVSKPDHAEDMPSRWYRSSSSPTADSETQAVYTPSDPDHDADDDGDDEEDEGINNIMMNMTVKSLHNLASYPNPNQKKAQKALLRPVKPRLNLPAQNQGTFAADSAVRSPWERPSSDTMFERPGLRTRQSISDSVSSQLMAKAELQNITKRGQRRGPSPSPNSDTDQSAAWLAHLALGAPRPLTAGPPGQRQYRASTFKSTFKALNTDVKPKPRDDEDAYAVTATVLQHAGIDDAPGKLEGSLATEDDSSNSGQLFQDSQTLQDSPPGSPCGYIGSPAKNARGHVAAIGDGLVRAEWGRRGLCTAERSYRNPEYKASLAAYMEKMNKLWYIGCETLCKEEVQAADEKAKMASWGVIGDGRLGYNACSNRHGELRIQEANEMETSEHAKPLLDMALANMERRLGELLTQYGQK